MHKGRIFGSLPSPLFFTEDGLAALRRLLLDRRAMDPERFGHLRHELELIGESE
jgi:hypothetical protein